MEAALSGYKIVIAHRMVYTDMKHRISPPEAEAGLAAIRQALEELVDPNQIRSLHDRAADVLSRIRKSGLGQDLAVRAAELKLLVERKGGEILSYLHLQGGDRKSAAPKRKLTLDRLGLSRKQSAQWQEEAVLPEEDLARYLQEAAGKGMAPSSRELRRLAKIHLENAELARDSPDPVCRAYRGLRRLIDQRRRFGCIYIDLADAPAGTRRARGPLIDPRLARLPLMDVAARDARVYLKGPFKSLPDGQNDLAAWGFTFETFVTLREAPLDPDERLQSVREMLLLGVRDGCERPIQQIGEGAVLTVGCTEELYGFMERTSPSPRLDLLGFRPFSDKWTLATTCPARG